MTGDGNVDWLPERTESSFGGQNGLELNSQSIEGDGINEKALCSVFWRLGVVRPRYKKKKYCFGYALSITVKVVMALML